jgi:hypothetical protein
LADGAAFAPFTASTGIKPDRFERLFPFFGLNHGCAISYLCHFSLEQRLAADTFARLHSHGVTVTSFSAAANVDLVAYFQVQFVAFGRKGATNQKQGKNDHQYCKRLSHVARPPKMLSAKTFSLQIEHKIA